MVTAGPGATNAVTGIVSAHLERIPLLVICGDVAWAAEGGRLLQDSGPEGIGIEKMLGHVTRATIRVTQAKTATAQGLAALNAAKNPANPGPALLVLPIQLGRGPVPLSLVNPRPRCSSSRVPRQGRLPNRPQIGWPQLRTSPAGDRRGVSRAYASTIRKLVMDAFDIPFVTTPQAKGLVSELHPRSLRHGGLAASLWAREYIGRGVDAALVRGYGFGRLLDRSGCCATSPKATRLVHVDLNASVIGRNLPTALGVVADLGAFAEDLQTLVVREGCATGKSQARLRELRHGSPCEHANFRD